MRRTRTLDGKWLTNVNQTVAEAPIFEVHAGHASEFTDVVGHNDKPERSRMTADHHAVRPGRRPYPLKLKRPVFFRHWIDARIKVFRKPWSVSKPLAPILPNRGDDPHIADGFDLDLAHAIGECNGLR